ncbi:hypothetical protein J6590_081924 [Homalodisca vitripennis]|nr:hypothetical protein J6590_081924 [Homalodisca vitripennis]
MRVPPAISADVDERKTSLEIVPISKISNSRGANQKYKLNCNGKAIMYRANHVMPRGLPRCSVCRQTDENAFLRMTGWRSTYTADPTRDREFACGRRGVKLIRGESSIRGEEFACGRRGVKSSRGEEPGTENTHSPYIVYLLNTAQQHTEERRNEQTIQRPVRVNGCGIKISRTTDIKNLFSRAQKLPNSRRHNRMRITEFALNESEIFCSLTLNLVYHIDLYQRTVRARHDCNYQGRRYKKRFHRNTSHKMAPEQLD